MKTTLCILTLALLTGCASQKHWGASGGSKADGIVKLSYQYTYLERPKINDSQAQIKALQRCQAWGYTKATPFDFENKQCQTYNQYGCASYLVTREFQCTSD